jgi:hypothetical protein
MIHNYIDVKRDGQGRRQTDRKKKRKKGFELERQISKY